MVALPTASESVPDFVGDDYLAILEKLHATLRPRTYLEIGTNAGDSLLLARCKAVAVDPEFKLGSRNFLGQKPLCALYQVGSDDFFRTVDPTVILGGNIDMAFLDGMHRCEFLLRDFVNTERYCNRNSVIVMHDCIPVECQIAQRDWGSGRAESHRSGWWSGDVWRTALLLKRLRTDLRISAIAAPPTGLVIVTNLNPQANFGQADYSELVREMFNWQLEAIGVDRLHAELCVEETSALSTSEQITRRFWL